MGTLIRYTTGTGHEERRLRRNIFVSNNDRHDTKVTAWIYFLVQKGFSGESKVSSGGFWFYYIV